MPLAILNFLLYFVVIIHNYVCNTYIDLAIVYYNDDCA